MSKLGSSIGGAGRFGKAHRRDGAARLLCRVARGV